MTDRKASPRGKTPCAGKWQLFDSTDPADHAEAKSLCETCPFPVECLETVTDMLTNADPHGGPRGTWAGRGFGLNIFSIEQREAEEARYSHRDAQTAHNEYSHGMRSEWINTGERVFQRRGKRVRRMHKDGAA